MQIVAAGIVKCNNQILIAQRRKDKSLGLYWEFPGGKQEEGEALEQTIKREFLEELDKEIEVEDFFMENVFDYEFGQIKLVAFWASAKNQEIQIHPDHEQIMWVDIKELKNYNFAPADKKFIEELDKWTKQL